MEALLILLLIAMFVALTCLVVQNAMLKVRYETLQETLMTLGGRSPPNHGSEIPSRKSSGGGQLAWFMTLLGALIFLFWLLFRTAI